MSLTDNSQKDSKYSILDLGFDKLITKSSLIPDLVTPELQNIITQAVAPKNVTSGELLSILRFGKTRFDNTESGFILGLDESVAKFYIGDSASYLNWDGVTLTVSSIAVAGGSDEAYGATWDASLGVPTKNAIYDKIEDILNGVTFTGDVVVPDEAYGAGWNASLEVPTKNAVYDKVEDILDGVTFSGDVSVPDEAYGAGWNGSVEVPTKNAVYDKIETISASITYKSGAATKDLTDASTTQNIAHGIGTTPKMVKVTGVSGEDPLVSIATTIYTDAQSSVYAMITNDTSAGATGATFRLANETIGAYQAGVVTVDATNIIITWTKTGLPAGTARLIWEAVN